MDGRELKSALAFTENGARKAQQSLEQAEQKLRDFKRRYQIVELEKSRESQIVAVEKLTGDYESLQIRLAGTRSQAARIEAQLAREPRTEAGILASEADPLVQQTERDLALAEERRQALGLRYTAVNEKVVAAEAQVAALRQRLLRQRASFRQRGESANPVYGQLRNRLAEMEVQVIGLSTEASATGRQLVGARQQLNRFPASEMEMARLQRQLEIARGNYTLFSQKREDLQLRLQARRPGARVMEEAAPPTVPVRPNSTLNFIISVLLGLMLGVLLSFFQEYVDDRVNSADEVGQLIPLPSLGVIPLIVEEKLRLTHSIKGFSPVSEAYRSLRTNLSFAAVDNPMRTLTVTSSTPGEGKSTTAANLATAMAMEGKRVILVDADLRRPTLHKLFRLSQTPGLTDVLVGSAELAGALHSTETPGMRLLTAGSPAPNPAEIIGSEAMAHFIDLARASADVVIFDSPPVLAVTDALLMASVTDGVLFVVGMGTARRGDLKHSIEQMTHSRARVLGLVLNKIQDARRSSYYYYTTTPGESGGQHAAAALPDDVSLGSGITFSRGNGAKAGSAAAAVGTEAGADTNGDGEKRIL